MYKLFKGNLLSMFILPLSPSDKECPDIVQLKDTLVLYLQTGRFILFIPWVDLIICTNKECERYNNNQRLLRLMSIERGNVDSAG